MKYVGIVIITVFFLLHTPPIFASYILPYPSYMPGNRFYKIDRLLDVLRTWWNWGSIASTKNEMALSDKYLVEAITLFEYQQYPLAINALARSDDHFAKIVPLILRTSSERKDVTLLRRTFFEEASTHIEMIQKIKTEVPPTYNWQEERSQSVALLLASLLSRAIDERVQIASFSSLR